MLLHVYVYTNDPPNMDIDRQQKHYILFKGTVWNSKPNHTQIEMNVLACYPEQLVCTDPCNNNVYLV